MLLLGRSQRRNGREALCGLLHPTGIQVAPLIAFCIPVALLAGGTALLSVATYRHFARNNRNSSGDSVFSYLLVGGLALVLLLVIWAFGTSI